MKKIIMILALFMSLSCLFAVSAYAETGTGETNEPGATEETEKSTILEDVKTWIEKVTSSTSIATLIASVLGFGGTFALISSRMKSLIELIQHKADADVVSKTVKQSADEIAKSFTKELEDMRVKLNDSEERNKILSGVLGIAFSYSKDLPASARAQIMALLNGTQTGCENVQKIVEAAKEAIEAAEATKEEEPTPALDSLTKEESKESGTPSITMG